jgi:ferritin-like metal-binding protein YciE
VQMDSLRELYVDELKDLYSAEKQLVKALPKMAKNATSPELQDAFTEHLAVTEDQVARLEQIFEALGESPRGKKCVGMEGIIEEANELLGEDADEDVLDAGLISKAQHVEHYEIAGYGTVRTYAMTLGLSDQAQLLQQSLDEEVEADKLLSQLAESSINIEAAIADESEEGAEEGGEREVSREVASEGGRSAKKNGGRKRPSSSRESTAR